jgi:hypothetical protein
LREPADSVSPLWPDEGLATKGWDRSHGASADRRIASFRVPVGRREVAPRKGAAEPSPSQTRERLV